MECRHTFIYVFHWIFDTKYGASKFKDLDCVMAESHRRPLGVVRAELARLGQPGRLTEDEIVELLNSGE